MTKFHHILSEIPLFLIFFFCLKPNYINNNSLSLNFMPFCPICCISFPIPSKQLPLCSCFFCADCLTSWVLEKLSDLNTTMKSLIKCPQHTCKREYPLSDYISLMNSSQIVMIYDVLAKKYCQNSSDIRSCPRNKCENYGFLLEKACDELMRCTVCNEEWEDYSQYSIMKKIKVFFRDFLVKRNEFSSSFFEEIFTDLCPNCDVHIQKNGGCVHMTCSKCQYQFCWLCKQQWIGHFPITCAGHFLAFIMISLLIFFIFINKLGVLALIYGFIWWITVYFFRHFIYNNLFFFWVGFFFANFNHYRSLRVSYYYKSAISVYLPLIGAMTLAILMLCWMIYQGTLLGCLYFGMIEVIIGGAGIGSFVSVMWIWDNWMSLVY